MLVDFLGKQTKEDFVEIQYPDLKYSYQEVPP
jgi:hypothetical protein